MEIDWTRAAILTFGPWINRGLSVTAWLNSSWRSGSDCLDLACCDQLRKKHEPCDVFASP